MSHAVIFDNNKVNLYRAISQPCGQAQGAVD